MALHGARTDDHARGARATRGAVEGMIVPAILQARLCVIRYLVAAAAAWALAAAAHAVPPSVMEPYRAYMAAIEADDHQSAAVHAEAAYRAGVAAQIDTDTLAALAENRARILYDLEEYDVAGPAWDDLYALAPHGDVMALAASAYLLAGDGVRSVARAHALLADGRELSDDVSYLARYVIAVDTGGDHFTAATGRQAYQRGRAPEVVQDLLSEGERRLRQRNKVEEFVHALLAAGAASGIGLHPSLSEHFRAWAFIVELTEAEVLMVRERLSASLFADLLVRQGVFPSRSSPDRAPDEQDSPAWSRMPPQYPAAALRRNLNGVTIVRFDTDVRGRPENLEIVFSVPEGTMFDRESIRAVQAWRYQSGAEDGERVRREAVETTLRFTLH